MAEVTGLNGLKFHLFGKLCVSNSSSDLLELDVHKVQELLAYLIFFRHRPHSRDVLADLLWNSNPTNQSKSYLRRTLWQLQNALDQFDCDLNAPLLLTDQEWLQINPQTDLWIDVELFEETYGAVRGIPGEMLSERAVEMLKTAVELHRGSLLEGWYEDWCIFERERLQHIQLVMLDKLMHYCRAHAKFEDGIEYGLRILRRDRSREYTHRQLMRLYYMAHDRNAALLQYERCAKILQDDLDVVPTPRTRALYAKIKSGLQTDTPPPPALSTNGVTLESAPLLELLQKLSEVAQFATTLTRQLESQIEIVNKPQSLHPD